MNDGRGHRATASAGTAPRPPGTRPHETGPTPPGDTVVGEQRTLPGAPREAGRTPWQTAQHPQRLPAPWRVGAARGVVEIKKFTRERDAIVFSFAFPIVMLTFFGSIFDYDMGPISGAQYYLPAMLAFGLMSVSFLNLGVSIAMERDDGTLKRMYGTPMPRSSYFIGKVILVLTVGVAEAALLIAVAAVVLGVDLPTSASAWATFAWVTALGITAFTLLGIAVSSVPRSGRSAAAVINLPYILLQFISGIFIPLEVLPEWVRNVGAVFPPRWLNQGLQSVFLPDSFAAAGAAGSWDHGTIALVLGAWCVGGLVLCLATFRWNRRDG